MKLEGNHKAEEKKKNVETYRALLPETLARISLQLCLWCWRSGKGRIGGVLPGLGDLDVGGKPRRDSKISSSVVELGLGLFRTEIVFSNPRSSFTDFIFRVSSTKQNEN